MRPWLLLRKAAGGMRNAPFAHLVSALTIGVALVLSGAVGMVALQARSLLDSWGVRAELTMYLAPDVGKEQGELLAKLASGIAEGSARYVSPADALQALAVGLGEEGRVLAELRENPLPASVEVTPGGSHSIEDIEVLALKLEKFSGVVEVDRGSEWMDRVVGLRRAADVIGLTVLPVLLLGAGVLAGSVVRLSIHARAREIEVMRIVGATNAFVRAPFVCEGALSGLAGGMLGALGLWVLAHRLAPALAGALPLAPEMSPQALASPLHLSIVVLAGTSLGVIASLLSVGRHLK